MVTDVCKQQHVPPKYTYIYSQGVDSIAVVWGVMDANHSDKPVVFIFSNMFARNVDIHLPNFTASSPKRTLY